MVGRVGATGRARDWLEAPGSPAAQEVSADPCTIANWPLVAFDGTIVACCNQNVVDRRPVPPHLLLGHAAEDEWPAVRAEYLRSSLLRGVRMFGPEYVAERFSESVSCEGYCETCYRLSTDPSLERRLAEVLARPSSELVERQVSLMQRSGGGLAYAKRFGVPQYAELVALGYEPQPEEACVA
jgi:hypothetical protein